MKATKQQFINTLIYLFRYQFTCNMIHVPYFFAALSWTSVFAPKMWKMHFRKCANVLWSFAMVLCCGFWPELSRKCMVHGELSCHDDIFSCTLCLDFHVVKLKKYNLIVEIFVTKPSNRDFEARWKIIHFERRRIEGMNAIYWYLSLT